MHSKMATQQEMEVAAAYQKQSSMHGGCLMGATKQHVTLEELLDSLTANFFRMQEQSYRFEKLHVDLTGERALPPDQPTPCAPATDAKPPHLQTFSSLLHRYEQLANEQQLILDALNRLI